jgi:uncharacterized surface protein with fasciclin (FAS1) repeats
MRSIQRHRIHHRYEGGGIHRLVFLPVLAVLFLNACHPEYDKFERPEWIGGKIFQTLESMTGVDSFRICLRRTGYDTILNAGNYSVFAPDNEAFQEFLADHPHYRAITDIPAEELLDLVRSHMIQNPWSRDQLQQANEEGWIDPWDRYHREPWGYKRQTLNREPNRRYWVKYDIPGRAWKIVDSTESTDFRIVYQPSRKYVPVFFDRYMELAGLSSRDFEFYFDRPFERGFQYFEGARLDPEDYFAENGFIFKLDRVVPPLRNAEQLLENPGGTQNYSRFLEMIRLFPQFTYNQTATNAQEGVDEGREVPKLYDLDYDTLVFDVHEEMTGRYSFDEMTSTRYHYGLVAPNDEAIQDLIDQVITVRSGDSTRWPTFNATPGYIKKIIVNTHMSRSPIHLKDMENGFLNGEWDTVFVDPSVVVEKHYGSNTSFIGVSEAVVPRAFLSVTAPVYLRPQYKGFMNGLELCGLTPFLKRRNGNYAFFVVQVGDDYFNGWNKSAIIDRMLDQVGQWVPHERARKEFIPTYGGNYILYDTLRPPVRLEEPTDNGRTYSAGSFLRIRNRYIFWVLFESYRAFWELIQKAGLLDFHAGELYLINERELYTVFAPSNSALSNFQPDSMSTEELQQFVKYHFVWGDHVFTDGNQPEGDYRTLRIEKSSGSYFTEYSTLHLHPEPDRIGIYEGRADRPGNLVWTVAEDGNNTNYMTITRTESGKRVTSCIIHRIDTVLVY